ncbi:MAG: DUF4136 domain-containing protein [Candidatus Sulfotelmatobacter sp.]
MTNSRCWLLGWLIVIGCATSGFAQKTKIGYDKSSDFSKYKTYTWAKPDHPIERPVLFQTVVGTIDQDLQAKGLTRVDANGDLTLSAAGGIDFGYNMPPTPNMNSQMWYGDTAAPILLAPLLAQGTLILQFVDRADDKMVWRGTVMQKLDPEQKDKALVLAEKAIDKLLTGFPPKH